MAGWAEDWTWPTRAGNSRGHRGRGRPVQRAAAAPSLVAPAGAHGALRRHLRGRARDRPRHRDRRRLGDPGGLPRARAREARSDVRGGGRDLDGSPRRRPRERPRGRSGRRAGQRRLGAERPLPGRRAPVARGAAARRRRYLEPHRHERRRRVAARRPRHARRVRHVGRWPLQRGPRPRPRGARTRQDRRLHPDAARASLPHEPPADGPDARRGARHLRARSHRARRRRGVAGGRLTRGARRRPPHRRRYGRRARRRGRGLLYASSRTSRVARATSSRGRSIACAPSPGSATTGCSGSRRSPSRRSTASTRRPRTAPPPRTCTTSSASRRRPSRPARPRSSTRRSAGLLRRSSRRSPPCCPARASGSRLDKDPFITPAPGSPGGAAAFVTSYLRPSRERPDVRVYVTLWDSRQLALHMEAGTVEPISANGEHGPGIVPRKPEVMRHFVAAFNGGFQAQHGEYGMESNGVEYLPPKPYAATVVELRDGSNGFGAWPNSAVVPDDVVGMRQNLTALVQDGKFNPWGRNWWGERRPAGPTRSTAPGAPLHDHGGLRRLFPQHEHLGRGPRGGDARGALRVRHPPRHEPRPRGLRVLRRRPRRQPAAPRTPPPAGLGSRGQGLRNARLHLPLSPHDPGHGAHAFP